MGRHSKAVKLVGGVRDGFALLDDDECRWAIEPLFQEIILYFYSNVKKRDC